MTEIRRETITAIAVVREALELASAGTGEVRAKVGRDVVTDADVAVEDHLRQALTVGFDWPVIGEERGGQVPDGTPYWLIDPICGTRNFASGIPLFAVNAAMVEDGRVAIAVVGDGSNGDVLVAEIGRGAWRVRKTGFAPLSTSASNLIGDFGAWPTAGPERDRAAFEVAEAVRSDRWDVRCFSTTLSLAYVATGQVASCVLFAAPDLVHIAAGALLIAEAGGAVTDTAGEPWTLDARSLVCSADERFHDEVLDLLQRGGVPVTSPPPTPEVARYELVIFDNDGVVVDSELLANRVLADLLTEHGFPMTLEEAVLEYMGGTLGTVRERVREKAKRELPEGFDDEYHERLFAAFDSDLRPVDGIERVLSGLDTPYCLASSGTIERIERSLTKVGLRQYFGDRVFSAEQVTHGKPAPDLFLHAAAEMEVRPGNCVVVEDSPNGVAAARAAGMTVFGYSALTPESRLSDAHRRFSSMDDLTKLLTDR